MNAGCCLQFEMLSHHGKEHYCTLSLVRVYGISMVDEYEAEASIVPSPLAINEQLVPIAIEAKAPAIVVGMAETVTMPGETVIESVVTMPIPVPENGASGSTIGESGKRKLKFSPTPWGWINLAFWTH